jgi:hypothetical protein
VAIRCEGGQGAWLGSAGTARTAVVAAAAATSTRARTLAEDFLDMAEAYYEDGEHFYAEGDLVSAFACVNYAHGWLDAGARLGLWDVEEDDQLFTLAG